MNHINEKSLRVVVALLMICISAVTNGLINIDVDFTQFGACIKDLYPTLIIPLVINRFFNHS